MMKSDICRNPYSKNVKSQLKRSLVGPVARIMAVVAVAVFTLISFVGDARVVEARRPAVLVVVQDGANFLDINYLKVLYDQEGFDVDYVELAYSGFPTLDILKNYQVLVITDLPLMTFGLIQSQQTLEDCCDTLDWFLASGGGVLLLESPQYWNSPSGYAFYENTLVKRYGAGFLQQQQIVEDNPENRADNIGIILKDTYFYTDNIAVHPVTAGCDGLWYPINPFYDDQDYQGDYTYGLTLSPEWQVLIRGSKTSYTRAGTYAYDYLQLPVLQSRQEVLAPPLLAAREFENGRMVFAVTDNRWHFAAATHPANEGDPNEPIKLGWVMRAPINGRDSCLHQVIVNAIRWLAEPGLAGGTLGENVQDMANLTTSSVNTKGAVVATHRTLGDESESNPVLWLKLDETSGMIAVDSSGYGHNGILMNGPSWTNGAINGAIWMDGVDDYVTVDNIGINETSGGYNTVAFWMKWNGRNNQMPFCWNTAYDLCIWSGGFGINTGEGNCLGIASTGLSNQWVHVAVVFPNGVPNTTNAKMYINGVPQTLTNRWGGMPSVSRNATPKVLISGYNYSADYKFGGAIDDVRVYNRELMAVEVGALGMKTNQLPTVVITSPANGTSFTAPANITVNASDLDGNISKMEFYQGSTKLGEDAVSPYMYMWSGVAAGNYALTVRAINCYGVTMSAVVNVTVQVKPVITTQPVGQTVATGQTATFSMTVSGTEPLNYQWRKNGANISGATNASYTTPKTTLADNGSVFSVVVDNAVGNVTSSGATLTVVTIVPVLSNDLTAHWKLDTLGGLSNNIAFDSIGTNHGIACGTVALTNGHVNNALSFDGLTGRVNVPSTETLKYRGGNMSLSCWIKINANEKTGGWIISKPWNYHGRYNYFLKLQPDHTLYFYLRGSNGIQVFSSQVLSVDTWHQVGFTLRDDKTIRIYLDGVEVGSATHSITDWIPDDVGDVNSSLAIGTLFPYNESWAGDISHAFSGLIDDVRLYNRVLSADEMWSIDQATVPVITTQPVNQMVAEGQTATFSVTAAGTEPLTYQWRKNGANISGATNASYTTPATIFADDRAAFKVVAGNLAGYVTSSDAILKVMIDDIVATNNLTAHWKMDGLSNNVAADSAGSNHGTAYGNVSPSSGHINGALSFDGLAGRINIPSAEVLKYRGGNMSMSAWIKIGADETGGWIISKPWNYNGRYNYYLMLDNDNKLSFYLGGSNGVFVSSSEELSVDEWHNVGFTLRDYQTIRIYLDGVQVGSAVHDISNWMPVGGDINKGLAIGTVFPYNETWVGESDYSFEGMIDDMRLYNRVLSVDEMRSIYNEEPYIGTDLVILDFEVSGEPGSIGPINASISSTNAFTGQKSLKGARTDEGGLTWFSLYQVNDIPLKPGCFYKISATINASARAELRNIYTHVFFAGTPQINTNWVPWTIRPDINFVVNGKKMEQGWVLGECIMQVPDNRNKGTLRIGAYMAKGDSIFFDNIKLTELPPMVDLLSEFLCKEQKLKVALNVAAFMNNPGLANISGTLKLIDNVSGNSVFSRIIDRFDSTVSKQTIDISNLPGGQYDIVVELFDASGKNISYKQTPVFICKNQPWMNNQIGVLGPNDNAPEPWTNLEYVSANIIKTKCGKYTFNPGPLPAQIESAGQNILAAPAQFKVITSLGPVDFANCQWQTENAGKNKGAFSFSNSDKDLLISGTAEIEFDGMIKYTVRLQPLNAQVNLKSISLEFPLTEEASTHFNCPTLSYAWGKRPDIFKLTNDWSITNSFQPMVWIGSVDRGLCWFAERFGPLQGTNWNVTNAYFECHSNITGRTFKVNMLDVPTIIKQAESPEFVFGIQATPTKPRIKNWRAINFRTPIMQNFDASMDTPYQDIYAGFPIDNAANEVNIKAYVNWFHNYCASLGSGAPGRFIFYVLPTFVAMDMPEYKYFKQAWDIPSPAIDRGAWTPLISINPTDINWQDFFIYHADAKIKKYGYDGLYMDCVGPVKTSAKDWSIFGVRELHKRLYIMAHKNSTNGLIMMHTGQFVPIASFSDVALSGEQYRSLLVAPKPYYLDFMTLKEFRQEVVANFGSINMLLAQYRGPEMEDPIFGAHIMGMALLHDVSVYAGYMPQQVFDDVTSRWVGFGKGTAEFVPYWSESSRANCNNDNVKISYYQKPNGLFLIAMNTSTNAINAVVNVNTSGIQLSQTPWASIYIPASDEENISDFNGQISISLDKYQPALIEIK